MVDLSYASNWWDSGLPLFFQVIIWSVCGTSLRVPTKRTALWHVSNDEEGAWTESYKQRIEPFYYTLSFLYIQQ